MNSLYLMSTGTQLFIIGFTVFAFTMIRANRMMNDDPSNIDMRQYILIRYDLFTAAFFMVGSMFF